MDFDPQALMNQAKDVAEKAKAGLDTAEGLLGQAGSFLPEETAGQLGGFIDQAQGLLGQFLGSDNTTADADTASSEENV
jgi:hypothetical protein